MNVTYSDDARRSAEAPLLQDATKELEEVLGKAADRVTAEWGRTEDANGGPRYLLQLSDRPETASASFTRKDLNSPSDLRTRLRYLWDDLLRTRGERLVRQMSEWED